MHKHIGNKQKTELIMNFRKATENDVSVIVEMIADDELGKKRENFQIPLPSEYLKAFEKIIDSDHWSGFGEH